MTSEADEADSLARNMDEVRARWEKVFRHAGSDAIPRVAALVLGCSLLDAGLKRKLKDKLKDRAKDFPTFYGRIGAAETFEWLRSAATVNQARDLRNTILHRCEIPHLNCVLQSLCELARAHTEIVLAKSPTTEELGWIVELRNSVAEARFASSDPLVLERGPETELLLRQAARSGEPADRAVALILAVALMSGVLDELESRYAKEAEDGSVAAHEKLSTRLLVASERGWLPAGLVDAVVQNAIIVRHDVAHESVDLDERFPIDAKSTAVPALLAITRALTTMLPDCSGANPLRRPGLGELALLRKRERQGSPGSATATRTQPSAGAAPESKIARGLQNRAKTAPTSFVGSTSADPGRANEEQTREARRQAWEDRYSELERNLLQAADLWAILREHSDRVGRLVGAAAAVLLFAAVGNGLRGCRSEFELCDSFFGCVGPAGSRGLEYAGEALLIGLCIAVGLAGVSVVVMLAYRSRRVDEARFLLEQWEARRPKLRLLEASEQKQWEPLRFKRQQRSEASRQIFMPPIGAETAGDRSELIERLRGPLIVIGLSLFLMGLLVAYVNYAFQ